MDKGLKISLIAAMADNRVIGINNQLPWRLPADLGWFKKNTLNKPVVMGRKTWESLPVRPLPGRPNIILTRDARYQPASTQGKDVKDVILVDSIDNAVSAAEAEGYQELMFIGGATLYAQVLPRADRLYLTLVQGEFAGDAWFPEIDFTQWHESYHQNNQPDDKNKYYYRFIIYERN